MCPITIRRWSTAPGPIRIIRPITGRRPPISATACLRPGLPSAPDMPSATGGREVIGAVTSTGAAVATTLTSRPQVIGPHIRSPAGAAIGGNRASIIGKTSAIGDLSATSAAIAVNRFSIPAAGPATDPVPATNPATGLAPVPDLATGPAPVPDLATGPALVRNPAAAEPMSAKATVPAREQGPRIVAVNPRAHDRRVEAEDNTPTSPAAAAVAVAAARVAVAAVVPWRAVAADAVAEVAAEGAPISD